METNDTDLNDPSKAIMLFGRDIRKIPCFKNSMLYGIYSGFTAGLATFMLTSRIQLATHVIVGSYMGVATVYWCFCRYTYVKNKYAITELQQMIKAQYKNIEEKEELQDDKML